jgi:hypothetical protein
VTGYLLRNRPPRQRPLGRLADTVPQITIPVGAGPSLSTGPPNPDRILLTGLGRQLRAEQTVTISLTFARAGHATPARSGHPVSPLTAGSREESPWPLEYLPPCWGSCSARQP